MRRYKLLFVLRLCSYVLMFNLLFLGCVSVTEKAGQFLDGSSEKVIELYRSESDIKISKVRNRNSVSSLLIEIEDFSMIRFRASLPNDEGNIYLTSLEYLSGNVQGWNEFYLDILGTGSFTANEQILFTITEKIEPVQISSGRIQRIDTRIVGDEALTALRNRYERIAALTAWMASVDTKTQEKQTLKKFTNYWKPILFPELVSGNKRPALWHQEGDVFLRAEDIRWNTGYTERLLPQELRAIRDSGTLLRDWEEAISWIYMQYEWDSIMELLSQKIILQKIK